MTLGHVNLSVAVLYYTLKEYQSLKRCWDLVFGYILDNEICLLSVKFNCFFEEQEELLTKKRRMFFLPAKREHIPLLFIIFLSSKYSMKGNT
jgi:hypothetical protein